MSGIRIIQPHRQKSDHDEEAGGGYHLGIFWVFDEKEWRNQAADQKVDNPEDPPIGTEGDEIQAGDNARDLGLIAHEELEGLQEKKAQQNQEDHTSQWLDQFVIRLDKSRPER